MHLWERWEVTRKDIAEALSTDTRPTGPDGCSSADRIAFIMEVFEMDQFVISTTFDFTGVTDIDDPIKVCAVKHLALLKLAYTNRCFDHGLLNQQEYDAEAAPLILSVQRIEHHLSFLEDGLPTPPFSVFR